MSSLHKAIPVWHKDAYFVFCFWCACWNLVIKWRNFSPLSKLATIFSNYPVMHRQWKPFVSGFAFYVWKIPWNPIVLKTNNKNFVLCVWVWFCFFCINVHEMCFELKFRFVSMDTLIIIGTNTHDLSLPIEYLSQCTCQCMSYEANGIK